MTRDDHEHTKTTKCQDTINGCIHFFTSEEGVMVLQRYEGALWVFGSRCRAPFLLFFFCAYSGAAATGRPLPFFSNVISGSWRSAGFQVACLSPGMGKERRLRRSAVVGWLVWSAQTNRSGLVASLMEKLISDNSAGQLIAVMWQRLTCKSEAVCWDTSRRSAKVGQRLRVADTSPLLGAKIQPRSSACDGSVDGRAGRI